MAHKLFVLLNKMRINKCLEFDQILITNQQRVCTYFRDFQQNDDIFNIYHVKISKISFISAILSLTFLISSINV